MNSVIARHLIIGGLVQGVGFRYFAQRAAARHQVFGYVRNLENGNVEAFVQGPEDMVNKFRDDVAAGPRYSNVTHIEETVVEPNKGFMTFRIDR
jgi:acylphosphatase